MSERVAADDDQARRADYLAEVTSTLYPPVEQTGETRYIAVPDAKRPRVLVPAASRRLAAAALRRYARPASRLARFKRDAAVVALHSGVDQILLRDRLSLPAGSADINTYLRNRLGTEIHLCIHIGPARANRKPVLQLLNCDNRTVGFAKLGTNPLTRALVGDETSALRELADANLRLVRIPAVLHSGTWRENTVLVQEPLPGWRRPAPTDPVRLAQAMRELAQCRGVTTDRLIDSTYAVRLRERLDVLAARGTPDGATLIDAADRVLARHWRLAMRFGAWHGDWTPWNMSMGADRVLLWDFERFGVEVPFGFDALHYALQRDIVSRGGDPTTAVLSLLADASRLLARFDVDEDVSRVTVLLYLVDLAARYMTDRQAEAGAVLGALGRWLLPTLLRHVVAEGGFVL